MSRPTIERVRLWLGWPEHEVRRLHELDALPRSSVHFALPAPDECDGVLRRLDVPGHARAEVVAALPSADAQPEAWWLLERLFDAICDPAGRYQPPWPAPEETDDPLTRYFHLYAFLGAVDQVLERHGARGIPADVTFDTLQDLGLQVAHYQTRNGRPGFDGAFWMWPHFRGNLFRLGRLQFDPMRTWKGEPVLDVHIPALGPLSPDAVDDAFDQAHRFFPAHFSEIRLTTAMCRSWLMDEQLAAYLPESSNIIAFQRRFTNDPTFSEIGDQDVLLFTFGRVPDDLDAVEPDSAMQRAALDHLRAGKHWMIRVGLLEL